MSEIISIPILELMEKTEQWLLNQGYKKNTLGVYKATWNKFRAYSSSPFYDRETAEKFLLRYFGVDANAIDQKLDMRMRHARRHMSALDEFLRTGEICRRKIRGITTIADDGFDLFFSRFQEEKGVPANSIELRMLNRNLASDFLDWLEVQRKVSVTTRNQRLAAMKAFAHYVQYRNPEYLENCTDIIAMRPKKHEKPVIPFLTEEELKALLAQPDPSTRHGLRDLTLLSLLYDSGARVQEITDLKLKDIRLTNPAMVTLTGKGRKARQVPLMKETCKLLDAYIRNFNLNSEPLTSPLFFNQKGQALSRYGITYILKKYVSQAELDSDTRKISPHVLRHTKAMHLLRAGVNMIYIRDFLGHVDISTTEVYARIDAEMKRKVFEEKVPNFTPNTTMPWEEDKDLLQWLTKFGKKSF